MEKKPKKERVIHTRVPEQLDAQLKDKAQGLGMSVSKLIRNVLTNTFDLVDDIVADSAEIARSTHQSGRTQNDSPETESPEENNPSAPTILGWQAAVLNLNAVCISCNEILPKGQSAHIGITDGPASVPQIMCNSCIKELENESTNPNEPEQPE